MTDADDPTDKLRDEQIVKKKREEALPERLLRRVLEGMGSAVDRRLGRTVDPRSGLTTSKLISSWWQCHSWPLPSSSPSRCERSHLESGTSIPILQHPARRLMP